MASIEPRRVYFCCAVIHDDQAHGNVNCGYQGGPTCGYNQNEGYGDALNCYITLQAVRH